MTIGTEDAMLRTNALEWPGLLVMSTAGLPSTNNVYEAKAPSEIGRRSSR